jgi:spheroidene monooxygenase
VGTIAVLVLVDLRRDAIGWGWSRLVLGSRPLRAVPGLGFVKVLGSGAGGGFGISPSATHQGLFLVFDTLVQARHYIDHSPTLQAYRAHARELCVVVLRACSSKGSWSGAAMEPTAEMPVGGPVAALTRASIRLRRSLEFWSLSPPAQAALESAPGCLLAAGLGEAPVLRQATFSLWSGVDAMDAYARQGAHQEAIRASMRGDFFSETMFVRFVPLEVRGVWKGRRHG